MTQSQVQQTPLRESRFTIADGIAELSHQRHAVRNALSIAMIEDYNDVLDRVEGDRTIRVLILTGSGGSFCAGGDIKSMRDRLSSADPELSSPDYMRRRLDFSQRMLMRLRELDVPVIAAVDGAAYGAGFGLALQSDFLLASARAAFCMSFARIGAVPDYGVFHTLPRIVGMARAKEMTMTARRIPAEEGLALGFVHAVYAPDDLLPQAHAFARRLREGPREALGLTKRLLNRSYETDYATLATLEACAQAVCLNTPYHAQAAARFVSGEPALYDWDRATGTP
jgi:2-(1,2-epoxy-1,2-dihydrophenyl)acetyl-CoA isomerase